MELISMPEYTGAQPNTIKQLSSYESWLRSEGAFELANKENLGDVPAMGTHDEQLAERQSLSPYAATIEDLFKHRPVEGFSLKVEV